MIQHIRIDWDPVWFLQHSVEDQSQSSKMIKVTILLLICAPLLAYAASSGKSHKMMLFFHPGFTPEGNLIISMIVQVRNVERRHSVQILTSSVMKASGLSFDFLSIFFYFFFRSFQFKIQLFPFYPVASNGKGRKVQEPITALGPASERGRKHQRWGNSYKNGGKYRKYCKYVFFSGWNSVWCLLWGAREGEEDMCGQILDSLPI